MNYNKYLERICYDGESLKTNISTLKELCECHNNNVPFDNFDMFGGKKRTLELEKIYEEIVCKRRGGLCYENNGLFCWLLRELGFKADILRSKVDIAGDDNPYQPLDHMCLMVSIF